MQNLNLYHLENYITKNLWGKISLLEPQKEKEAAVNASVISAQAEDSENPAAQEAISLDSDQKRTDFIKEFLSYDIIDDLLQDVCVEDIMINSLKEIYIHHSQKGLIPTGKRFVHYKFLDLFLRKLVLFSGRTQIKKVMNLELPNLEGRANIIVSPFGPQITITKAKMEPLSVIDLIQKGTMTHLVAAQIWLYLEGLSVRPANIIISGGPGVGKTTFMNALFSFIPAKERLVVIEDTLELNTDMEDSCSRLETDEELTLADLVKNSLRMRPERIIVGEVRGEEARDMITAVNVGKYCMGTIHAATAREAILRLQNEPMNIPEVLVNLVDVFILLKRYHIQDKVYRVVDEISETSGMEQKTVLLSQIFKYDFEKRKTKMFSPSTIFRDKLARASGLTAKDIIDEVNLRAFVLETMDKQGVKNMGDVTAFCRAYSENPDQATQQLDLNRKELLKHLKRR